MKIYIDSEYKCHLESSEGRNGIETTAFDGKCKAFIEGYRFIPFGKIWQNENGEKYEGETFFPWRNIEILQAAQMQYEESLVEIQNMQAALKVLGIE